MNLFFNTTQSIFFQDPSLKDVAWRVLPDGSRIGLAVPNDPMPPSYDSSLKPRTFIDRVQFGDGYEQITESGLRSQKRIFDLRWNKIPQAKALAIQRFLTGEGETSIYYRRPSEWFYWLPPSVLGSGDNKLPIRVICVDSWSITPAQHNCSNVTATFEESFQL